MEIKEYLDKFLPIARHNFENQMAENLRCLFIDMPVEDYKSSKSIATKFIKNRITKVEPNEN